jgi:acylphosphatase
MPPPNDYASLHTVVRGRVQGVGFREFVIGRAQSARLTGYVRNLPNGGAVEVVAEGLRVHLEAFLGDLEEGPRLSSVQSVEAHWGAPTGGYSDFGVRF